MPFFKQRKPKRFQYKSRLGNQEKSSEDFKEQWQLAREQSGKRKGRLSTLPILLLLLIMVLILLYVLKRYE